MVFTWCFGTQYICHLRMRSSRFRAILKSLVRTTQHLRVHIFKTKEIVNYAVQSNCLFSEKSVIIKDEKKNKKNTHLSQKESSSLTWLLSDKWSQENKEFKKLRRLLQRKRHIEVRWSVLRLSHVGHVVRNSRSALPLASHESLSCKGKERKIYCCGFPLSSDPQIWTFHVVI